MTTNDITGDTMRTKPASDAYLDNYDAIFRRKPEPAADWPESAEERIDMIALNGGDGLHYGN